MHKHALLHIQENKDTSKRKFNKNQKKKFYASNIQNALPII